MLFLYKGQVLSRILYVVPLLPLASDQWEALEAFHRVSLGVHLGVPRFTGNLGVLVEVQAFPLRLQAGV